MTVNNVKQETPENTPDTAGHRKRLREKFINSGFNAFHEYEIVELLLTLGTPRRDVKQAAKEALKRFKTLRGVLEAPAEQLQEIPGIGPHNTFGFRLVKEIAREYLKDKAVGTKYASSSREVYEHLCSSMSGRKKELFKVLYLDSQNGILASEDLFTGTVNSTAVFPREVIEGAIRNRAVSLVFAHNHPSGNPEPSQSDKDLTRDLIFAANAVNMKVLDHIIIGHDRYFSFAGEGLIEQDELSFKNTKAGHSLRNNPKNTSP